MKTIKVGSRALRLYYSASPKIDVAPVSRFSLFFLMLKFLLKHLNRISVRTLTFSFLDSMHYGFCVTELSTTIYEVAVQI